MVMGSVILLVLFALVTISFVVAAPNRLPLLQGTSETEPNNSFSEADQLTDYMLGEVSNTPVTDTIDYFVADALIGRKYQAALTIDSPKSLSLRMVLWNGDQQYMTTSSSSPSSVDMSWTAGTDSHYIRVEAVTVSTTTFKTAEYRLDVFEKAEPTDTPTPTPTRTPTPTPSPTDWDEYEPNDSREEARAEPLPIETALTLEDLNFHPYEEREGPDEDWFAYYVKKGYRYRATTSGLSDCDTRIRVYDSEGDEKEEDDDGAGGLASEVEWKAKHNDFYYVLVENKVNTTGSYNLRLEEAGSPSPVPSPTPGVVATPRGRADDCEDNLDFERACVLPVNESQTFNLVPAFGEGPDNDFYKIWVKPGLHCRCETSGLAPGVDPNMIVFNGPSWDHAIGGNDDIAPGDFNSAFNYYATYSGWLYVLVGTGKRTPSDVFVSSYTLRCDQSTEPFTATRTPSPTPDQRSASPTPTGSGSPVATPTPETHELTIRPLTTPRPPTTSAPRFVPISLVVYYDANSDRQPGAGEGIAGISAQAYELASDELLARGFTDEQGSLEFTVSAQGPVRLSVPFLGYSHSVGGAEASIQVRVPPRPTAERAP
jgi:hypothetical protein